MTINKIFWTKKKVILKNFINFSYITVNKIFLDKKKVI